MNADHQNNSRLAKNNISKFPNNTTVGQLYGDAEQRIEYSCSEYQIQPPAQSSDDLVRYRVYRVHNVVLYD